MRKNLKNLTLAALFGALVYVATLLIKIPVPVYSGYVHIGDALLYTAALFLPPPYAMAAGALGASLADLTLGYTVYAPFTFVIKALKAQPCNLLARTSRKALNNGRMSLVSGVLCIGLYYVSDLILYGVGGAVPNILGNVVQAGASSVVFAVLLTVFSAPAVKNQLKPNL